MIWKAWNKHVEYCESLNKSSWTNQEVDMDIPIECDKCYHLHKYVKLDGYYCGVRYPFFGTNAIWKCPCKFIDDGNGTRTKEGY
jgi:hypothetical protein